MGSRRLLIFLSVSVFLSVQVFPQVTKPVENKLLFHGMILDASTEEPLPNSQIFINNLFTSISDGDGKFAFYVSRKDTVVFSNIGYKKSVLHISDTLKGKEFIAGVFMQADTINIGEVVIFPRMASLRSDLLRPSSEASRETENARYNMAVASYQGRVNSAKMGDPSMNYEVLRQQQKNDAYSKGQIPSDKIAAISPLLLIPAAYLLIHGMPEKPSAVKPVISDQEINMIISRYMESLREKRKEEK